MSDPTNLRMIIDAAQFVGTIAGGAWVTMLILVLIEWTGGTDAR